MIVFGSVQIEWRRVLRHVGNGGEDGVGSHADVIEKGLKHIEAA